MLLTATYVFHRTNIQSQANLLTNNLQNIADTLAKNHDLLSSTVTFPLPTYPGRTQEGLLHSLIRKRLEPSVEDWVEHGKDVGTTAFDGGNATENNIGLTDKELQDLWDWAPVEANREARRRAWGGDYTLEEKEMGFKNVVTGLRRKLDEGESDDEEEEEDEDEEGEEPDEDEMEVVGVRRKSLAVAGQVLEFDLARAGDKPVVMEMVPMNEMFRFGMTGRKVRK
jgi:mediator of RNA polymerase II transcription subunit 8